MGEGLDAVSDGLDVCVGVCARVDAGVGHPQSLWLNSRNTKAPPTTSSTECSSMLASDSRTRLQASADSVFQPEGTSLLPPLTSNVGDSDLEGLLDGVFTGLGPRGKEALKDFLDKCKLPDGFVSKAFHNRIRSGTSVVHTGATHATPTACGSKRRIIEHRPDGRCSETPCGETPGAFRVGFLNWHQLTDRSGNLRLGPYLDGIESACTMQLDVLLSAELGTTDKTLPINGGRYTSDWSTHARAVPGVGVGCFFDDPWADKWTRLESPAAPTNSRFLFSKERPINCSSEYSTRRIRDEVLKPGLGTTSSLTAPGVAYGPATRPHVASYAEKQTFLTFTLPRAANRGSRSSSPRTS